MDDPDHPVPDLSVVVPLFNEERVVGPLHRRLVDALDQLDLSYEIIYIDDGSRDATPWLLDEIGSGAPGVGVVHLSRNFGHQAAVTAGLDHASGRAVVVMDGDLQDPPEVIPRLVERWEAGFDVVYAVRRDRKEGRAKRLGYHAFYRIFNAVSDLAIPLDSGDFCLMGRRVVDALKALPERTRFVRGLRTFVGFRQVGVSYERAARAAGRPKYTARALVALAVDGVVGFSGAPLRFVTYLGLTLAALAALLTGWVLVDALSHHTAPRGWSGVLVAILGVGSMQMIGLGIVGEYVRQIFLETKGRPPYIVAEFRAGLVPPLSGGRGPVRPAKGPEFHDRTLVGGDRRRQHGRGHPG